MAAYFSGKRELFKGLALEKLEQKWTKHPILHLDLNTEKYKDSDSLEGQILNKNFRIGNCCTVQDLRQKRLLSYAF
jgi:hypothetical protein